MNQRQARAGAGANARPVRGVQENTNTRQSRPMGNQQPAPASTGDAWDELDNMGKGHGDENGFNKMNTSYYLSKGEEANIVLLDENPIMFKGHSIQCLSSQGKKFWRTEACQKSEQSYCVICDRKSKAIGKAYTIIAFRVLDERGKWDSETNDFDYIPAPKIFLVPIYLAKMFKAMKDQAGTISDKVIKLKKDDKYIAQFDMINLPQGGLDYNYLDESVLDDMVMPDIYEVYAPMSDEDLNDFLDEYADTSGANQNSGGGQRNAQGNRGGGFGNGNSGAGNQRGGATQGTRANGRTGGFGR